MGRTRWSIRRGKDRRLRDEGDREQCACEGIACTLPTDWSVGNEGNRDGVGGERLGRPCHPCRGRGASLGRHERVGHTAVPTTRS